MTHRPAEKITLEVPGHRIACLVSRSAGEDRPPLVLLHGIGLSVRFWPRVIQDQALAERNWIAVSLPGHFPSAAPAGFRSSDITPELFAEVVAAAVRDVWSGRPAHLVGWSTGGFSALAAAALHPELTASVTSVAGFARGKWSGLLGLMQRLAGSPPGSPAFALGIKLLARRRAFFSFGLKQLASTWQTSPLTRDVRDLVYEDFRRHDLLTLRALFAGLRRVSSAELLPKITAPVLLIGGARDVVVPPAELCFLAESIPTSRLLELESMGHMFYAEAREEVLSAIQEWVAEVERGRKS